MLKKKAVRQEAKKPHLKMVPPAEPHAHSQAWPLNLQEKWIYIFLGAIAFALYAHTLAADFLRWDDRQNILLNPWIDNGALSLIWTRPYYNMYIPITYTLWTALWHIDPHPWLFHLANVLFHVGNTVMVYMFARKILKPEEKTGAIFAALIFCCHPLQVETVAWISTFRDTLACFFSMWASYLIVTREEKKWMAGATVLFCVALLCKPSVCVIPAALLFLGYGFNFLNRARVITLGTWFIPALVASYVTKRVQQLDADLRLVPMDLGDRMLVAVDTLSFYIQKFFAPYPLAADYGRTRDIALEGDLWIIGLVAAAVAAGLIWAFRKKIEHRHYYFFGFFVLFVAPVLGIIPFQAQGQTTVSDRYVYMSLIGLGLMFGAILGRKKLWPVGAGVLAVLSVMTLARAEVWQTNEGFFRDMLAKNERSHVALSSLGVEYILTGRLNEAEVVLNKATVLKPMDVIPRTNLAQLYLLQGRPDRVLSEVVPMLNNKEFLRINQTETRALASAYRLAARAHWALSLWSGANDYFCRWFNLDYENEDGKQEIMKFMADAKAHGAATLPNCEVKTRY
jgi:hypothetical protein